MYTFKQFQALCGLAKAAKATCENPYDYNRSYCSYAWWVRLIKLCQVCGLPEPTPAESQGIEYGWQHYCQIHKIDKATAALYE